VARTGPRSPQWKVIVEKAKTLPELWCIRRRRNTMHGTKNRKQVHILPKHPYNCQNPHTLHNPHTYTYPHTTKEFKTITVQDIHQMKWSQYNTIQYNTIQYDTRKYKKISGRQFR
jgi:hypothetical protein